MFTHTRSTIAVAAIVGANLMLAVPAWGDGVPEMVADTMQFMREEEKLARDVYATLYADSTWGSQAQVFDNIAYSEQRHMDAMGRLLDKYGIPDPVVETRVDPGIYPDSCTGDECVFFNQDLAGLYKILVADGMADPLAGLLVGGLIEEKDMTDIQAAIDETDDPHIQSVYERLLCGSTNHLRAFARNIESATGLSYLDATAAYIGAFGIRPDPETDSEEYAEYVGAIEDILTSSMRTCGSENR